MTRAALTFALLVALSSTAQSHQLDELLQATRLNISPGRIVVELDVTPGVAIASRVFAEIDRDGDARVSASEVEWYARGMLQDVSVWIDGLQYPLTLSRAAAPSWDEIQEGTGTIRVEAFADAPAARTGRHRISYENRHQPAIAVFLVNALKPASDVTIRAQRRDVLQSRMDLDVDVAGPLTAVIWPAFLVGGLMCALLVRLSSRPE